MFLFLLFLVGFLCGWFGLRVLVLYRTRHIMKLLEEPEQPKLSDLKTIKLNFTKIQDMIYAYDSSNDHFMARGLSKDEIVHDLQKRFPKTHFTANPVNLKEVGL